MVCGRHLQCVYVAEQNRLAAEYLLQTLANDRRVRAFPLGDVVVREPESTSPIFVVDRAGIDLPLWQCLQILNARYSAGKVIVLDQERSQMELVQLLSLGIRGFVSYPCVEQELIKAVHWVSQGKMWFPADALEAYVQNSIRALNGAPVGQQITKRESEVFELVKRRLSNKEIATILRISVRTAKFHVGNILHKLNVTDREQLRSSLAQGVNSPVPPVLRPVP